MRLSDLIQPLTPAGAALFLQWQDYHVFSIPKRELTHAAHAVRFSGVGGKRQHGQESFAACALREGEEEIGQVIDHLESAEQTYFLRADGQLERIQLTDGGILPQLVWEKRCHSSYGSMADSIQSYYLVAFNASLKAQPIPCNEVAAILYLKSQHLALMQGNQSQTLAEVLNAGGQIDFQPGCEVDRATPLIPHGTGLFLLARLNQN